MTPPSEHITLINDGINNSPSIFGDNNYQQPYSLAGSKAPSPVKLSPDLDKNLNPFGHNKEANLLYQLCK